MKKNLTKKAVALAVAGALTAGCMGSLAYAAPISNYPFPNIGTVYANEAGAIQYGWFQAPAPNSWDTTESVWYYSDPVTGVVLYDCWIYDNGKWYYLNPDGSMINPRIGNNFMNPAGDTFSQWAYINGAWYWFDGGGAIATNAWRQDSADYWYYLGSSGAMQTGWLWDNGWYYLYKSPNNTGNPGGSMAKNCWIGNNGNWYYMQNNGLMYSSGWILDGYTTTNPGTWYYATASGAILTNTFAEIDGVTYYFNGSGAMLQGNTTNIYGNILTTPSAGTSPYAPTYYVG